MKQRTCGDCIACCTFLKVEFERYTKPARKVCLHVLPPDSTKPGRCGVYGKPCKPQGCTRFECAWLRGTGLAEDDRPDASGVMLFVMPFNGGTWGFAMELEPGAVLGKGARAVTAFARSIPHPVIVTSYEREPGLDTGDRVVLKDELLPRAKSLIGAELAILEEGVKVYELYDHHKGGVA